jgi:6,7-dimethyl-8-ribityllumazine synthase
MQGADKGIEQELDGLGLHIGIVQARFNEDITNALAVACIQELEALGVHDIDHVLVPGALEVPIALQAMAERGEYDALVALGCIIRGETTHYDTVCNDSSRGLTMLGLQGLCIGNGILTVENRKQAEVRADTKDQNKGGGAAAAALHLIALARKWGAARKGVGFVPAADDYRIAGQPKDTPTA